MGLGGLARLKHEINTYGIRIHGPAQVFVGDTVVSTANITRRDKILIPIGTAIKIQEILVRSQDGAGLGFEKRIRFEGIEGEFSPNKFRKSN